jgi:hypothetical protein
MTRSGAHLALIVALALCAAFPSSARATGREVSVDDYCAATFSFGSATWTPAGWECSVAGGLLGRTRVEPGDVCRELAGTRTFHFHDDARTFHCGVPDSADFAALLR